MESKRLLRTHTVAIVLAALAAAIAAFPQVHFRVASPEGVNQGVELLPDSPWTPRAREFMDGHGFGSIYYADGKEDAYLFQPLGSAIVGYTGKLLGLDINDTFIFTRIVSTFAVFLLVYGFVLVLSRSRLAAIASASLILPAQPILSMTAFFQLLSGILPGDYWEMAEPVNPGMIYLFFFGFLLLFWKFLRTRDWRWGVASALVLGANFYNYFYTWTYLYAFGGILFLIYLFRKEWPEAKRVFAVFVAGTAVGLPYLYNLYQVTQHPNYQAVSERFAVAATHTPLFIGLWGTVGILAILFFFPKAKREEWVFGLALMLTPIVTLNQQIITGMVMQTGHYHWYFHRPAAIIFTLIAVFYLLYRYGWGVLARPFAIAIVLLSFFAGGIAQWNSYFNGHKDSLPVTLPYQKYGPALDWLNEYGQPGEAVFANNNMSHFTVVYTPLDVFYHRSAHHMLSSTAERLRDQIFTFYRLRGVEAKDAPAVFDAERKEIITRLYGLHHRDERGVIIASDEDLARVLEAYQESLAIPLPEWMRLMMAKYGVDYAVWNKDVDPAWNLSRFSVFEEAAEFGPVTVYRVKQ